MSNTIAEFGDFQTPVELASRICRLLAANGHFPKSVLEPTCQSLEEASAFYSEARI